MVSVDELQPILIVRLSSYSVIVALFSSPPLLGLIWDGQTHQLPYEALNLAREYDPDLLLDDDDVFGLFLELRTRRYLLRAPLDGYQGRFDLDALSSSTSKSLFRFENAAIRILAKFFWGTEPLRTGGANAAHGHVFPPEEGFAMLLWRLAGAAKLAEGMKQLPRTPTLGHLDDHE